MELHSPQQHRKTVNMDLSSMLKHSQLRLEATLRFAAQILDLPVTKLLDNAGIHLKYFETVDGWKINKPPRWNWKEPSKPNSS